MPTNLERKKLLKAENTGGYSYQADADRKQEKRLASVDLREEGIANNNDSWKYLEENGHGNGTTIDLLDESGQRIFGEIGKFNKRNGRVSLKKGSVNGITAFRLQRLLERQLNSNKSD